MIAEALIETATLTVPQTAAPVARLARVIGGRYRLTRVIGHGSMSTVYEAHDLATRQPVALKRMSSRGRAEQAFARELETGQTLRHPNVCRILDAGREAGTLFLTMELATGGALKEELERRGPPATVDALLSDVVAITAGLAALHGAGRVHRDLKTGNILRLADGRLVVSDFGLTRPVADAQTMGAGTPAYMAPEILDGQPATFRSDVWALGVVVHELLFGHRPVRDRRERPKPPADGVRRALLGLCRRCLRWSGERPRDAGDVLALLEPCEMRVTSVI